MIQVMDVGQARDAGRFKLTLIATAAFVGIVDLTALIAYGEGLST